MLDTVHYYNGLENIYDSLFDQVQIVEKDSSAYFTLKRAYSDDRQPVQFRMFDNKSTEIFKIANCYIDPPIPMTWNVDGCFDTFPPKTTIESLNLHSYDLQFLLSSSSLLNQTKVTLSELPQADYYGVILWNEFYIRPSKKLIKTIRKKLQKGDESMLLIFINNHNAHLWQIMDSESKERVKTHYDAVYTP